MALAYDVFGTPERRLKGYAQIVTVDGHTIDAGDDIISFSVDKDVDMPLGVVASAALTLKLNNSGGKYSKDGVAIGTRTLMNAQVTVGTEVYHDPRYASDAQAGSFEAYKTAVFFVYSVTESELMPSITLKGYDSLTRLDFAYQDELPYRANTTLQSVFEHVKGKCQSAGFVVQGELACNASMAITRQPAWGDDATVREVLGYVLQMGGCYARAGVGNLIYVSRTSASVKKLVTPEAYFDYTAQGRYFKFNRLKFKPYGAKKDADYLHGALTSAAESAANTLVIEGNPLLKTTSTSYYRKTSDTSVKNKTYYVRAGGKYVAIKKGDMLETTLPNAYVRYVKYNTTVLQSAVSALAQALNGLEIRDLQARWRGDMTVEAGDKVSFVTPKGENITTSIIRQSIRYEDGSLSSNISCSLDLQNVMPAVITSTGRIATPSFGEGTIDGKVIVPETITGDLIVKGGITAEEIAAKTITAEEIKARSITAEEIAARTITANEIKAKGITAEEIAAKTITSNEMAAKTITAESGVIDDLAIQRAHIANAAVDNTKIADATIEKAKISAAAIEQLQADFLEAVRARIEYLNAHQVITDSLYANLAEIAKAQIKSANFDEATVGWLTATAIGAMRADIANIVANNLTTDQLYTHLARLAVAQITTATINNANISWAEVNTLSAVMADMVNARMKTATIDYAKIVDLVTETAVITRGEGDQLHINRLAVTDANMVSLTTGELMLKTAAGDFVRLTVDSENNVVAQPVLVEGANIANSTIAGGKLIEDSITARELNVTQIFADTALIKAIKAANIDVANLFASEATIANLDSYMVRANTINALKGELSLWADEKIQAGVGDMDARLAAAEQSITSEAIVNTVVGSQIYQDGLNQKADADTLNNFATKNELSETHQTTLTQTRDSIVAAVRQERERAQAVEGELQSFVDTAQTYFSFSLEGLQIGKSGSPFSTLTSDTKMAFLQDGVEVAYIQYNRLYIKAAHIMDILTLGNAADGYTDITSEPGGITAEWRQN